MTVTTLAPTDKHGAARGFAKQKAKKWKVTKKYDEVITWKRWIKMQTMDEFGGNEGFERYLMTLKMYVEKGFMRIYIILDICNSLYL